MTTLAKKRRAISLLETTIAISVLGLGMIMLAAVFPVAMTRHRDAVDQARAAELVSKAEAMVRSRIDPTLLWVDPTYIAAGLDSEWYVMPYANIYTEPAPIAPNTARWDTAIEAEVYARLLNGAPPGSTPLQLFATDILSDRMIPIDDEQANEAQFRYIWYGFYRRLGSGAFSYAAGICRQRQNEIFYEQDFSVAFPTLNPTPLVSTPRRFPTPWRVTVARLPGTKILYLPNGTPSAGSVVPPQIAPRGAKIMVSGRRNAALSPNPQVPTGRILTVIRTLDGDGNGFEDSIEVLEDINDIFPNDPTVATDGEYVFDIWLFPPPAQGSTFGPSSTLVEWKVSL